VHVGGTLGIAQGVGVVVAWTGLSLNPDLALAGASLFLVLTLVVLVGVGTVWLCWRSLKAWRARSPKVLGKLYLAGLVLLPLGALDPTTVLFTPAGVLLITAAALSRNRVLLAERRARGGPG
jgi:hypothetical protein